MIHRFGAFEVDDQLFELRRAGAIVPIQPKAFDILCRLIESPTVVSRADLMRLVWPGVVVTNDSLAQAIMAARAALGDDGENPTFIQTVRARGYRFVAPLEAVALPQAAAPVAPVVSALAAGSLIGRAASLFSLHQLLDRARAGRGGICLVTGETGTGKTRIVEELCASPAGVEVISVRCYEGEGSPDLWPFAHALRGLRESGAHLEGDLAALADGQLRASTLADPPARFAVFDATVRALVAHARTKPLLLVIDDLHLADLHTLRLLALLSAQIRSAALLFVGVYGPTTPRLPSFRAAMGALAQEPSTSLVRVEPLGREDVAAFVAHATGRAVSASIVDQIFAKTRGNPLLLSQLVDVLGKEERLDAGKMATSALVGGDSMRDAITSMLSELPEAANRVLTVAAVFGHAFPIAALAGALDETNEAILRELDAAATARVVARSGTASYRFTYPLVRDVLYKRLLASERARLHANVATALGKQLGASSDHHRVAEIADHLVEAAVVGDVDAAVDCSLRAADLATSAGDHAAAAKYARRGLEALGFAQSPDEARRARLGTFLPSG